MSVINQVKPLNTWTRHPPSATVDAAYQAEVDRSMTRGRLKWESEQAALAKAERRRDRLARQQPKTAREHKITKRKLRLLDEQIELQRQHLLDVQRMMVRTGAPATSRGQKSFRPVPQPGDIL